MNILLPVVALAAVVGYSLYRRRKQQRLLSSNWEWLVSQLSSHSDFNFDTVSRRYLYEDGIDATPANVWEKINGAYGLCAMFRNAGIFLRLADYATSHGAEIPEELMESLRADALQIRLAVFIAITKYLTTGLQVAPKVNAYRAATAYSSMLTHTTELFQNHSAKLFPRFLECM